jgi:hypothetical protein
MASTVGNRPAQYRYRAEQARENAASATSEDERRRFLREAELWERMATYEAQHPTHDFSSDNSLSPKVQFGVPDISQAQEQAQQQGPTDRDDRD